VAAVTLIRDWYPTRNYSAGKASNRLLVLHTTEGFTGPNGQYDCGIYFQGNVGASSHVIIDNYHPGRIVEGVSRANSAWTQCQYNGQTAASVEQCGYAAWTRDEWLTNKASLLHNTADWLAEESAHFGIPLVLLTNAQSQDGHTRGVTYHSRLGSAGCGHSDPGDGRYPIDVVLEWARGGVIPPTPTPGPPEQEEEDMNTVMVPPGPAPVEVSFDGTPFKTLSFYGDATTYPPDDAGAPQQGIIRCAFYQEGSAATHSVQTVYVNAGRNKPVINVPAGTGGVSLTRQDGLQVTYYPNFGK